MKRLLLLLLLVPSLTWADSRQGSSKATREWGQALTAAGKFGVPRYTTLLLPACITTNKGAVAFDTTLNALVSCNGTAWVVGGTGTIAGDVELLDSSTLAGESLSNPVTFAATWTTTGDCTVNAGSVKCTNAGAMSGTFTQTSANGAVPWASIGSSGWFDFAPAVSNVAGAPICTITTAFAAATVTLPNTSTTTTLQAKGGTVGDFVVSCSSAAGSTIWFDAVSLKRRIGGDLIANGDVTVRDRLFLNDGTAAAPSLSFTSEPGTGLSWPGAARLTLSLGTFAYVDFGAGGVNIGQGIPLTFASSTPNGPGDLKLYRDAAATLQLGADAATPVAQTIKGADSTTAGNAGGQLTIAAGKPLAASTAAGSAGGPVVVRGSNATADSDLLTADALGGSVTIGGGAGIGDTAATAAGGNVNLYPGIGGRLITIDDYSALESDETITITANGGTACVATLKIDGTAQSNACPGVIDCRTSNVACATNVAAFVNAVTASIGNVTATQGTSPADNKVFLGIPTNATVRSLALATTCAGGATECTVASGNDGQVLLSDGTAAVPAMGFAASPTSGWWRGGTDYMSLSLAGINRWHFVGSALNPQASDTNSLGAATAQIQNVWLSRTVQGSKSKALTSGAATSFVRVAVPQTAGANFAGGNVIFTAYATDGTNSQTYTSTIRFTAVNEAGTEACTVGEVGTGVESSPTGTYSCATFTCATAAADTVDIGMTCTSTGLGAITTHTLNYRLDLPQPNTVTPQ